jgi:hypothetical protein
VRAWATRAGYESALAQPPADWRRTERIATASGDLVGLLRTRASLLRESQPPVAVLRLEPLPARLR